MNEPNDLHDRLIDSALCEVAGGHAPPDLSARIVAAVDTPATSIEGTIMERPKRTRRAWFALAIAACLLVGGGFLLSMMEQPRLTRAVISSDSRESRGVAVNSSTNGATPSPYYLSDDVPVNQPGVSLAQPTIRRKKYATVDLSAAAPESAALAAKEELSEWAAQAPAADAPSTFRGFDSKATNLNGSGHQEPQQQAGMSYGSDRYDHYGEGGGARAKVGYSTGVERQFFGRPVEVDRLGIDPQESRNAQGEGPGLPGDQYTRIHENPFIEARGEQAVSTFSIDVDTASYSNVRQFLQSGQLPPPDAVRLEELINYFDYEYEAAAADSGTPFSTAMEVAGCPWEPKHRLVRVALQGRELDKSKRPVSNLVFLIDVSGSMDDPNKLPLVVEGMKQLVRELGENDRVAIVVYASSEGLVLPSTPGTEQAAILAALENLRAGGSTAGGAGIQLAYQMAEDHFVQGGVNRVILCTDGDFNVGVTSTADLERMVEQKAKDTKVFLSVLGFGRGNLNDAMMETISNHGNGNYHYVDNLTEARKVLVEEMTGTLVTIAKDVKIQVEFNPAQVAGYRLLGYENRMLRTEDFNDDTKDAGEIGAGHRVTALYEIVPAGEKVDLPPVDELKYQQPAKAGESAADNNELLTLKLRFKPADGDTSTKVEFPLSDDGKAFSTATPDFKFAAAVACFGMLLRDSEHKGNTTFDAVLEIATEGASHDPHGYRAEFLDLVRKAKSL